MSKPRVLLAEDHVLVSDGLTKFLEKDFTLIVCVADGHALVQAVREHTPDVAVIDISLPLLNGLQAARQIKKYEPHTKVIFLTMHGEESYVRDAFQAGGSGYILKQSSTNELIYAIKEVFQGNTFISPAIAKNLVDRAWVTTSRPAEKPEPESPKLTQRQIEILQLVAEGKSNKEIAMILNLAVKTVEFHKTRLMQTIGVKTTAELTKYAIAQGLISP